VTKLELCVFKSEGWVAKLEGCVAQLEGWVTKLELLYVCLSLRDGWLS
jgi:hypothetical protein